MSREQVTFDSDGSWEYGGGDIQPMDVGSQSSGKPADEKPKAPGKKQVAAGDSKPKARPKASGKKPSGGFDLKSLRAKAGVKPKAPATPEIVEEPKKEETLDVPVVAVEQAPSPVMETPVVAESVIEDSGVEETPTSTPEPVAEEPVVVETATPDPVPEKKSQATFSLSSLNVNRKDKNSDAPPEVTAPPVEDSAPEVAPVIEPQAETPKPVRAAREGTIERDSDFINQGHFDTVPAAELLSDGEDLSTAAPYIRQWLKKTVNEIVRRPSRVFECRDRLGLRAYSIFRGSAANAPLYVVIGCGNRLSAVACSNDMSRLTDRFTDIRIDGAEAWIEEMLVAVYGQHLGGTIVL